MFHRVYFDISGRCNGFCHWCKTGLKNKQHGIAGGFVAPEDFARAIDYLRAQGMIAAGTTVPLYTWGEPLLHPDFATIAAILRQRKIGWSFSTNGSKSFRFEKPEEADGLVGVIFSVCGFSQASYDRIHGFSFTRVTGNLAAMARNLRECAPQLTPVIAYHVYQFNLHEIVPAARFAQDNGIRLIPSFAFMADLAVYKAYVRNGLAYAELRRAAEELFLYFVEEGLKQDPSGSPCPQHDLLTIDAECNVVTCCDDSTVIGKVWDLSEAQIREIRGHSPICKDCMSVGGHTVRQRAPLPRGFIQFHS